MDQITDDDKIIMVSESEPGVQEVSLLSASDQNQQGVEEIDSCPTSTQQSKPSPSMSAKKEEPIPNPILEDPYEWEQCAITVVYALLPDQTVSVSIHNHKDEPIVKSFVAAEVPLPEKMSGVMQILRDMWPDNTISATMVLMPKPAEAVERSIIVSLRAGNDTPIVQTGVESDLPLPAPINMMLDELKAMLPTRALKRIEKDAKTKSNTGAKPGAKPSSKTTMKQTTVVPSASAKSQLSLF
jgi:hypothetical protein